MQVLRILVADDHEIVRRGLREVLSQARPGWEIAGEAGTGREAVELARKLRPDVAILDISMPEMDGLEATRQILRELPETRVLILTAHSTEVVAEDALDAGARGCVSKSDAARDLVAAVEAVSHNESFFPPHVLARQRARFSGQPAVPGRSLSAREREIVILLAQGKSNEEIGAELGITAKTVSNHRTNIMGKLGIHSLTELVLYAVRHRLIEP